jgi:enoyl-CoA hydratase
VTSDALIQRDGAIGRLRLNRPKAIHALTRDMCNAMAEALLEWRGDPGIKAVLIDHAEDRGFCAGGDVVALAGSGKEDGAAGRAFFHDEYRLNHLLFTYPKPTLAIIDGITMGGGVGISMPCTYRIATENTRFAMPETGIGLFPDVGGGWYLPRLPGRTGYFIALTGARLDGAECHYLGIATHSMESARRNELIDRLVRAPSRIKGALGSLSDHPPEARIAANIEKINRLFAGDTMEEIVAALIADGSDWAQSERATLETKSPLSCKNSLRLLLDGARRTDFADEMRAEYALASRVLQSHDFLEGVRALLIDKDNAPQWDPPALADVSDAVVDAMHAPLPEGDEWTPYPAAAQQ